MGFGGGDTAWGTPPHISCTRGFTLRSIRLPAALIFQEGKIIPLLQGTCFFGGYCLLFSEVSGLVRMVDGRTGRGRLNDN